MTTIPHSLFPGAVFPAGAQTQAAALLAVQFQLGQSERLPPADLRALQFRQIGALVAHIDRCVPHYGLSLRKAGLRPGQPITAEAWARVPILGRAQVQQAGAALHATELPRGHGQIGEATTSGTSGRPVRLRKTTLWQFYWQCFALRQEIWQRRDLSAAAMTIARDDALGPGEPTGRLRRLPDWGGPVALVYPTGPGLMQDYRAPVAELADTLAREQPAYLSTFPSLLLELLRSGVRPAGLRQVHTMGEALSDATRALCLERWGVPIADVYSSAEAGIIAAPCAEHGQYHVNAESVLLEVLHPDGSACAPGETGQVVLTPLHNFAMPLLRYAIDDMAEVGPPCRCGRTLPVLARIPGRARGMLVLASGERRFPYYGHNALMQVDAIVQHQVVQTGYDEVELRLVVKRPLTAAEEEPLRRAAMAALGPPFKVRLSYRDEIARGPGGKYAEFYSELSGAGAGVG
ncbi:MAG: phenylacetate--CoA ligase family protein [Burkholderiales bacterium]|nr:phenylacetate--CoA ligase family protein [Burkholderiales bacterium]